MNNIFSNINLFTHNILQAVIKSGDHVLDATAGNGHDTLFLAKSVGSQGIVYSFDIQETAIFNTSALLSEHHLLERVRIIHDGHENMVKYISKGLKAVIFNLGYLPKSDHQVKTLPETTVIALGQALDILLPGGLITVTIYSGHESGESEKKAVEEYLKNLDKTKWDVLIWSFLNRIPTAPFLIVIHRRGG
ncbi:MAG: hypothetical protein VR72_05275 [Clostridiaceae bacterium BRH_c20a]|nr:MAG: hypothetical protein VR72_05275 [Clostridiaceae bacterium BRH_c20a]